MLYPKTPISSRILHPKDPYGVGHAALQPPAAPPTSPDRLNEGVMDPIWGPPHGTQSLTGAWLLSWPPWVICGDIQA